MLNLYNRRVGIFFGAICILAISVVAFSLTQVDLGMRKADANAIESPWDFSLAPPQAIDKSAVRIVNPVKTAAVKAKNAKAVKKNEVAKTASVANTVQALR